MIRLMMVLMLAITATAAGPVRATAAISDAGSMFDEGCDLYEQGDFARAAERFEAVVAAGVRNAKVYYNLGNSYYKQGYVGKAVVNYRRAIILNPRDEDVRENLDLLRAGIGLRDTTSSYDVGALVTAPLRAASPRELQVVFYVSYFLTSVCFLCVLFLKGSLRRLGLRIMIVLFIVTGASFGLAKYGNLRFGGGSQGVIVAERAEFMSGPGNAFDELARLPDGVEVKLRAQSGLWVEVELGTGDIGWVREDVLETI